MVGLQADVLVQVPAAALGEVHRAFLVQLDHLVVQRDGGGAGGQAEDGVGLLHQLGSEHGHGGLGGLFLGLKHKYLHEKTLLFPRE